jgi:hypothetical protein
VERPKTAIAQQRFLIETFKQIVTNDSFVVAWQTGNPITLIIR